MKKKYLLVILSWIGFTFALLAQTEDKPQQEKIGTEIGLNVSNFVKSFLSLNTQTVQASPYFFVFKHKEFRLHTGLRARDGKDFIDISNTNSDTRLVQFDVKAGIERRQNLTDRWIMHYGLDVVGKYHYRRLVSNTAIDQLTTTVESAYAGVSPFLGIQFKINKRLRLLTEADWIIAYGRSSDQLESVVFPQDLNKTDLSNFFFTELNPPIDLYLIFNF